jgi:hypothetical protein
MALAVEAGMAGYHRAVARYPHDVVVGPYLQQLAGQLPRHAVVVGFEADGGIPGIYMPRPSRCQRVPFGRGLGLAAVDIGNAVELLVVRDDVVQLQAPHQDRVISIGEGDVEVDIKVEDPTQCALSRQDDARKLYEGQEGIADSFLGVAVLSL